MNLAAALIYWLVVVGWVAVEVAIAAKYLRPSSAPYAMRLLLLVVAIDAARNIVENVYFGIHFGSMYGLFPKYLSGVLGQPHLLIIPKALNVVAAFSVLALLLLRLLPNILRQQKYTETNLKDSEWRFHLLVDGVKEYAIYLLDLNGHVTSWNSGAERIKGYTATEAIGMNFAEFYTQFDRERGAPQKALDIAREEGRFQDCAEHVRKDGRTFWAEIVLDAILDDDGRTIGFAKVTKDVTDAQASAKELEYNASHDILTGLFNRASLFRDLQAASDAEKLITLSIFDLDGFKEINDARGHIFGDEILRAVSQRFVQEAGPTNRIYRLGGDEFVLLAHAIENEYDLSSLTARLLRATKDAVFVGDEMVQISASAGSIISNGDFKPEMVLANADLALYEAKANGGDRSCIFTPAMHAQALARHRLNGELRNACANGEFMLLYQPQIRLSDGTIVGAEALLRWRHPTRGILPPSEFISALAKSRMAYECGNWILAEVCREISNFRRKRCSDIRIGVNLFPAQIHSGNWEDVFWRILNKYGVPAEAIELEITENIALNQDEGVIAMLHRMQSAGVSVAFDDFGTGYASLSCLTRYPLDRIKLDRSFISPLDSEAGRKDAAIVRSIVTMAHHLNLQVIAEGVENAEQAEFLHSLGCEEAQGYLYAEPLTVDVFEALLADGKVKATPH